MWRGGNKFGSWWVCKRCNVRVIYLTKTVHCEKGADNTSDAGVVPPKVQYTHEPPCKTSAEQMATWKESGGQVVCQALRRPPARQHAAVTPPYPWLDRPLLATYPDNTTPIDVGGDRGIESDDLDEWSEIVVDDAATPSDTLECRIDALERNLATLTLKVQQQAQKSWGMTGGVGASLR